MLRDEFIAFDEEIASGAYYYSADRFHSRLAAYDQLILHVEPYAETISGSWIVTVALETSGDGINWYPVDGSSFTALNVGFPLTGGAVGSWDSGTKPLMQLVRISIDSSANATGVRIRIRAALRDRGGGKPKAVPGGPHAP